MVYTRICGGDVVGIVYVKIVIASKKNVCPSTVKNHIKRQKLKINKFLSKHFDCIVWKKNVTVEKIDSSKICLKKYKIAYKSVKYALKTKKT